MQHILYVAWKSRGVICERPQIRSVSLWIGVRLIVWYIVKPTYKCFWVVYEIIFGVVDLCSIYVELFGLISQFIPVKLTYFSDWWAITMMAVAQHIIRAVHSYVCCIWCDACTHVTNSDMTTSPASSCTHLKFWYYDYYTSPLGARRTYFCFHPTDPYFPENKGL